MVQCRHCNRTSDRFNPDAHQCCAYDSRNYRRVIVRIFTLRPMEDLHGEFMWGIIKYYTNKSHRSSRHDMLMSIYMEALEGLLTSSLLSSNLITSYFQFHHLLLLTSSLLTFNFLLLASNFSRLTFYFRLLTSVFQLPLLASYFRLLSSDFQLPSSNILLPTSYF